MVKVEYETEGFMFAPDVQGPISRRALELICKVKPDVIMVGGPPFYLGSFTVDEAQLRQGLENLMVLAKTVPLMILEHHVLRDESWQQRMQPVYEAASKAGNALKTAAEFAGEENIFLESRRKRLYEENPPSRDFEKWMRESNSDRGVSKPPLN
jgi:hypothetical protein